jgi:hypothetical protein
MNMMTTGAFNASPFDRACARYLASRASARTNSADGADQAAYGVATDAVIAAPVRGCGDLLRKIEVALIEGRHGRDILEQIAQDLQSQLIEMQLTNELRAARDTIAEEVDVMRSSFCNDLPGPDYGIAPCPEEAELLATRVAQVERIDRVLDLAHG